MADKKYDYLIVGSGFYGSVCAYELSRMGKKVLVIEKRNHIGGNAYTKKEDDIDVHEYGAHIFHTNDKAIWKWIQQFGEFNNFRNSPLANYKDEIYSLPFSMRTFYKSWGVTKPEEAKKINGLIMVGVNPSYTLPNSKQFNEALKSIELSVSFSMNNTETSKISKWVAATPHYLESWGDVEMKSGNYSLVQPTIKPLFDTSQFQDVLLNWLGSSNSFYDELKNNTDVCDVYSSVIIYLKL